MYYQLPGVYVIKVCFTRHNNQSALAIQKQLSLNCDTSITERDFFNCIEKGKSKEMSRYIGLVSIIRCAFVRNFKAIILK